MSYQQILQLDPAAQYLVRTEPGQLDKVMREVEDWWIDHDFLDDKLSVIEKLKAVAQGLAAVDVPAIAGQSGWLVRNALQNRLGVAGSATPAYRLDVRLDDRLEGLGVLSDDTVGRERRTLRARYQLVDLENGNIVLDATAGSDAGIDVVSSVMSGDITPSGQKRQPRPPVSSAVE